MKKFFALTLGAVALMFASFGVGVSPASADVPPAAVLCQYVGAEFINPGGLVVYAEYKILTASYVQADCWSYWSSGPGIHCTYKARYSSSGVASMPGGSNCFTG